MAEKGPQIATAYVQLQPTFQGVGDKIAAEFGASGAGGKAASQGGAAIGKKFAKSAATAIGNLGKLAAGVAVGGLAAFARSAVSTGMEFDSAMAQVAATMGKTVGEVQELRDFAQEMGATTAFSATQAAEALNYMALAGYDAETSMAMLPNVLNLAAAGAMDLGRASDMLTDTQSALGLTQEETNRLVDKMAMAASKSNTSVEQLGDAILTVGGTAKVLKGGTTEIATALGILADNGIKGSEGGTMLRNTILALTNPTKDAAGMLEDLGVEVFDAEGNMRGLDESLGQLAEALDGMTAEERQNALGTIFNKRDLKAAEALLGNTGERWKELSGYIDDAAGAAQKMANTQLDNLAGDVTMLKSAWEGVKIAFSDGFTPKAREAVQELTKAISSPKMKESMKKLGEIAGRVLKNLGDAAVKIFPEVLSFLDNGAKKLKIVTAAAGGLMTVLKAISGDWIGALVTGLTTVGAVLVEDTLFAEDNSDALAGLTDKQLNAIAAMQDWSDSYDEVQKARTENLTGILDEAAEAEDLWKELQKIVDAEGNVKEGYEERARFITERLSELTGQEITLTDGVIEKYDELRDSILETIKAKEAAAIYEQVSEDWKTNQENLQNARTSIQSEHEAYLTAGANMMGAAKADFERMQRMAGGPGTPTYAAFMQEYWEDVNNVELADVLEMQKWYPGATAEDVVKFDRAEKYIPLTESNKAYLDLKGAEEKYENALQSEKTLVAEESELWSVRQAYMDGDLDAVIQWSENKTAYYYRQLGETGKISAEQMADMENDSEAWLEALSRYQTELTKGTEGYTKEGLQRAKESALEFFNSTLEAARKAASQGDAAAQAYLDSFAPMIAESGIISEEALAALLAGFEGSETALTEIGRQILNGLEGGLTDPANVERIVRAGRRIITLTAKEMRATAEIASPSRVTRELGRYLGEGLLLGMEDTETEVQREAARLAEAAIPDTGTRSYAVAALRGTAEPELQTSASALRPEAVQAARTEPGSERTLALLERLVSLAEQGQAIVLDDGTLIGVLDRGLGARVNRRERATT